VSIAEAASSGEIGTITGSIAAIGDPFKLAAFGEQVEAVRGYPGRSFPSQHRRAAGSLMCAATTEPNQTTECRAEKCQRSRLRGRLRCRQCHERNGIVHDLAASVEYYFELLSIGGNRRSDHVYIRAGDIGRCAYWKRGLVQEASEVGPGK